MGRKMMKSATTAKRGRPRKASSQRRRNNVTIRMRDQIKHRLEASAKDNGRSLSEEIEIQLEQSFVMTEEFFGGRRTYILMKMMADVFQIAETHSRKRWDDDPATFEDACRMATNVLQAVGTDKLKKRKIARRSLLHGYSKEELE